MIETETELKKIKLELLECMCMLFLHKWKVQAHMKGDCAARLSATIDEFMELPHDTRALTPQGSLCNAPACLIGTAHMNDDLTPTRSHAPLVAVGGTRIIESVEGVRVGVDADGFLAPIDSTVPLQVRRANKRRGTDLRCAAVKEQKKMTLAKLELELKKEETDQKKLDRENALPKSTNTDQNAVDVRSDITNFSASLLKCVGEAYSLSTFVGSVPHQYSLRDRLANIAHTMKGDYQTIQHRIINTDGPVSPSDFLDTLAPTVAMVKEFRKLEKQARPLKQLFAPTRKKVARVLGG